jgi:Tol biopolymer transport system component
MRGILVASAVALVVACTPTARGVTTGREDFPVSWSPDGRQILFERDGARRCPFLTIQPDGRRVEPVPGCGTSYAWATDGRLAFSRGALRTGNAVAGGIFATRGPTLPPRRLTTATDFVDSDPQWSPDGAWIAFARTRYRRAGTQASRQLARNIWVVRPDGSELHPIASRGGSDWNASWAPDSRHLVYVRQSARLRGDLVITDVGTRRTRRLTYGSDNGYPAWSPTGSVIMFERAHDLAHDGDVHLWSIRADGTGLRDLGPIANGMQAQWSPDGRRFAYVADNGPSSEIWLLDADGRNRHRLFTTAPGDEAPGDQSPVWSPDSRRIAFARFNPDGGSISLHVADADGRNQLRLTY